MRSIVTNTNIIMMINNGGWGRNNIVIFER